VKRALVLVLLLFVAAHCFAEDASRCSKRTLTTSGTVEARLSPDYAELRIGVETIDRDVGKAMSSNTEAVKGVIAAAKQAGVKEDDIALDFVTLESRRDE
jgi:uncharacterized protein YggE